MNASRQRQLAHLTLGLEQQWLAAWEMWGVTLAGEWRKVDPNAPEAYASEVHLYEQEWVSLSTAEERAGFLSRGASLCVQWGSPGSLWVWFWRDVYGPVLDGDLSAWPRLIPQPPEGSQDVQLIDSAARENQPSGACVMIWVASIVAR